MESGNISTTGEVALPDVSAGGSFSGVAAITVFCLSIMAVLVLVLRPTRLRIPWTERSLPIPFYWMPVLGVVAMLCCLSMSWADVGNGLKGDDRIKPYSIMLIFMSLAYIGASLDASGIFAYLALVLTYRAKGRGRVLFVCYFLLASFMTTFTSNDVCIVTLTPIIIYFAKAAKIDPVPFLMAEYAAGNIFGALLYVGNPTNIIVAQAYDISFLGFSKIMTLPTLAAGAVGLGVLWLQFKGDIPAEVALPTLNPRDLLNDKRGAVFGLVNAVACLALLAAAPSLKWEMWAICVVCAGIYLAYNAWALLIVRREWRQWTSWPSCLCTSKQEAGEGCAGDKEGTQISEICIQQVVAAPSEPAIETNQDTAAMDPTLKVTVLELCDHHSSTAGTKADSTHGCLECAQIHIPVPGGAACTASSSHHPAPEDVKALQLQAATAACEEGLQGSGVHAGGITGSAGEDVRAVLGSQQPTFMGLLLGLPWEVLPFALGFFVLVEGMSVNGWIDLFADGIGRAASQSLPAAIFLVGWLSVVLSNTINNQPMTIMMTRICLSPHLTRHLGTGAHHRAALFALVMGSNLGALFTLIGALAGIMWSNIMATKDLSMTYLKFLRLACPIGLACMTASLFIIWFEYEVLT